MKQRSIRRLAENEVIFRQVNTDVEELVLEEVPRTKLARAPLRFYCECSDLSCTERIPMTARDYRRVHKTRRQFVMKPGHQIPEVEWVVRETPDYVIAEKYREPPALIDEVDPSTYL